MKPSANRKVLKFVEENHTHTLCKRIYVHPYLILITLELFKKAIKIYYCLEIQKFSLKLKR